MLFIDNVDKLSEIYQQKMYSFAHEVANTTGATVIVSMREATFFRGKTHGFLDIRSNDSVFHLQTPDFIQIVSKRIKYVQTQLAYDHRYRTWKNREDYHEFEYRVKRYSNDLKMNLLAENREEILKILATVAWHNVRQFLTFLKVVHIFHLNQSKWTTNSVIAVLSLPSEYLPTKVLPNLFSPPFATYQNLFLQLRILYLLLFGLPEEVVRVGIGLPRILDLCRKYGYPDNWTKAAIQSLVQLRLLECLEIPAELEITGSYELNPKDTYRPSPLSHFCTQEALCNKIYLCINGNETPFHSSQLFEQYIKEISELSHVNNNSMLIEPATIELMEENDFDVPLRNYLVFSYEVESTSSASFKHSSEISAAESKLKNSIGSLSSTEIKLSKRTYNSGSAQQGNLFQFEKDSISHADVTISIPENIKEIELNGSTLAPAILWAMVQAKANGKIQIKGREIAQIINRYVFDKGEQKESTNVSRALRHSALRNQEWLGVEGSKHRFLYSLKPSWKASWIDIFKCSPPKIN